MLLPTTTKPEFFDVVFSMYCTAGGGTFKFEVVKHRGKFRILSWIVDDYEVYIPRYGRKTKQQLCQVQLVSTYAGAFKIRSEETFLTLSAAKANIKKRMTAHFSDA